MKIDYLKILKKAGKITWNNKYLWWFGLLIGFGGGGIGFNFGSFDFDKNDFPSEKMSQLNDFWLQHQSMIVVLGIVLFIFCLLAYVFSTIGRAGLISSLTNIDKKKKTSFSVGFKKGRKFFWKFFGLQMIILFITMLTLLILAGPIAVLFIRKAYLAGGLLILPALIIFVGVVVLISFLQKYSQLYLITSNVKLIASLKLAYFLFRKNIWSSILQGLILAVVGIIFGFSFLLSLIILLIPIIILGIILALMFKIAGIVITVFVGLLVIFIWGGLLGAIYKVFLQTVWFLFFKKIAKQKEKQKEFKQKEEIVIKKVVGVEGAVNMPVKMDD